VSTQLALFEQQDAWPSGLRYQPEFISRTEERRLIGATRELPLGPFQFGAFEGKRRVASFGFRYDYSEHRLHDAEPIPEFIREILPRAESFAGVRTGSIKHVLFTEYDVGAGIGWHCDKANFGIVLGLSLGAAAPLRFRRKAGRTFDRFTLEAAPRSLYLLGGEARSEWEHSIPPVQAMRWSITFRTMAK
jgi:alkylated DNA repair dioxygenase AlkB